MKSLINIPFEHEFESYMKPEMLLQGIVVTKKDETSTQRVQRVISYFDSMEEKAFSNREQLESTVKKAVDAIEQYQLCQKEFDENTIATEVISRFAVSGVLVPVVWMVLKTLPEREGVTKHNTFMLEWYLNQGPADGIFDSTYMTCRDVVKKYDTIKNRHPLCDKSKTAIRELDETDKIILEALIRVMEARDKNGNFLFLYKAHWDGIYMILKEKGLYDGTQKGFGDYLRSLVIPNLRVGLPGKDMMRSPANGKVFATWKPITAPEKKLYRVAELFKEELEKLLPE